MLPPDDEAPPPVAQAARAMRLDLAAVDAIGVLRRAGIDAFLLKGASFTSWLYPEEVRPYGDVDLLVPPHDVGRAVSELAVLGYRVRGHRPESARLGHAVQVVDDADVEIDLHRTLFGIDVPFATAWEVLRQEAGEDTVAGAKVPTLNHRARLLHVALRAAQDGPTDRAIDDLTRAVESTSSPWEEVVPLARSLRAIDALNAGLRHLHPAGAQVADRLGLPRRVRLEFRLQGRQAPMLAAAVRALRHERPVTVLLRSFLADAAEDPPQDGDRRRGRVRSRGVRPVLVLGRLGQEVVHLARESGAKAGAARRR